MDATLLHTLPAKVLVNRLPDQMVSPYTLPPHPVAQEAARACIHKVHEYMRMHEKSELHQRGKMFGVLVVRKDSSIGYLMAFSAQLDGSYTREGFVPPVYAPEMMPVGNSRDESRRLQKLLFANYRFVNLAGEKRSALDIFAHEKPILTPEEWFHKGQKDKPQSLTETLPPSGSGECCAPKLLQYALTNGCTPIALAEFWVGAPPMNELRREGTFYAPCSGRCVPILKWMTGHTPADSLKKTENGPVDILYEDEWLMVVNKPAGILSVRGKSEESSVTDLIDRHGQYKSLQPVHRLDRDTSGLLVLAKTPDVYTTLQAYFQRRDILKRYEALIVMPKDNAPYAKSEGLIDLPLLPNPYDRPRQMVDKTHGKTALTTYRIRERRNDGTALVDFFPHTGRTHQLRIHAAHPEGLNAPILGDPLYGESTAMAPFGTPQRMFLHAAEIRFLHPIKKEEMHFCIPSGF